AHGVAAATADRAACDLENVIPWVAAHCATPACDPRRYTFPERSRGRISFTPPCGGVCFSNRKNAEDQETFHEGMAARGGERPSGRYSKGMTEAAFYLALQAILSGILVGGVYGILSVGLSLAFGVMRIVNFAHGELVMYGMYAGVVASRNFGIDPLLILPLAFLFTALVGMVQYQVVFRHFVGHATLNQLLAAIGCALVLQMIAQLIFGADARTAQSIFTGQYTVLGPFFLSQAQIVAFVIAVAATLAVEILLRTSAW